MTEPVVEIIPANQDRPSELLEERRKDRRTWRIETLDWEPLDQRPKQMRLFLNALRQYPNVSQAAKDAGLPRRTVYYWRNSLDAFRQDWDDAIEMGTDHLEGIAYDRACEASDKLLIFLLRAYRPDRYREVRTTNVDMKIFPVRELPDEELARIAARSGERAALPEGGS